MLLRTLRRLARATSLMLALLLVVPPAVLAAPGDGSCSGAGGVRAGAEAASGACEMGPASTPCGMSACCCLPEVGSGGSDPVVAAAVAGQGLLRVPPVACACDLAPLPLAPTPTGRAPAQVAAACESGTVAEVAVPPLRAIRVAGDAPPEIVRPPGRCAARVLFCSFLI